MIERKVTLRYVRGLIEAAKAKNCVDEVLNALKSADGIIKENKAVTEIFYNPTISRDRKKKLLRELFPEKIPDLLERFICYIIHKKRERILELIYKEYVVASDKLRGIIRAKVISASGLTTEQIESMKAELEKRLKKKIEVEHELDRTVLGGVKIFIGTNVIDGSVTGRLDRLQKHLLAEMGQLKTAA